MSFKHPFQKICYVSNGHGIFLLGASGATIYSTDLKNGVISSRWPASDNSDILEADSEANGDANEDERPTKRQRVETEGQDGSRESSISVDMVTEKPERVKGQRRKPKQETPPPNVSHLIATKDGDNVIAVTAEDKCVRVFSILRDGRLRVLTQRCMPKRPCAIILSPDEATLLVGDKFGDVYALPLHPSDQFPKKSPKERQTPIPFQPSASELTVHTKGNLESLRQQREAKHRAKPKTGPEFEHHLILGHVSLLTDLAAVELPATDGVGKPRNYILTSDRDEHIRVSRGIPQAHVIETYCLQHLDFVSKLCIVPWQPDLLVSGSGEPSLKCYSWPTGEYLYNAFGHSDEIQEVLEARPSLKTGKPVEVQSLKIAVSGIWTLKYSTAGYQGSSGGEKSGFVIVAMEGLPILFTYKAVSGKPLTYHSTIRLSANILDLVVVQDQQMIIASLDTVHAPRSVRISRSDTEPSAPAFTAYTLEITQEGNNRSNDGDDILPHLHWQESSHLLEAINEAVKEEESRPIVDVSKWERPDGVVPNGKDNPSGASYRARLYSTLGDFLYGLENLRKKSIEDQKQMEKEEEGEGDVTEELPPLAVSST